MEKSMSIRQAAKWAERNDCVYKVNKYTGQPEYMYAVYSMRDNKVACIGYYEKCRAYLDANKVTNANLSMISLDDVLEGIYESEGEASCYLGQREENVSWSAV